MLVLAGLLSFGAGQGGQLPTRSAEFTVDISAASGTAFKHHWEECVGSGHASLTLRADWRAQLTRVSRTGPAPHHHSPFAVSSHVRH